MQEHLSDALRKAAAKVVQIERKNKFPRVKVEKMLVFSLLSEAEIQQKVKFICNFSADAEH